MAHAIAMPLFMRNHVVAPTVESEPVENQHYAYDSGTQRSTWMAATMGTTTTTCGKANRVDDTQKD